MGKIRIRTLWISRTYWSNQDSPELIAAWDDESCCENPEGWESECKKAIEAVGDDLRESREIELLVDAEHLLAAFRTPVVEAGIKP